LTIHIWDSIDEDLIQSIECFLGKKNEFSAFHSPSFFESLKTDRKNKPFYVVYESEGEILGLMLVNRQVQIPLPGVGFFSSRDVIASPPLLLGENPSWILKRLFTEYLRHSLPVYTQIRGFDDEELGEMGFRREDHLNIIIDLTKTEDELWKDVHSKRRNEIRKAKKQGVEVRRSVHLEELEHSYAILKEVYHRAQLPLQSFAHFASLLSSGLLFNFVAVKEDRIIGCLLAIHGQGVIYDYYAGADQSEYANHPNDLLPWEVMRWAKTNGYHTFDFGGAGKPTVPYGVREYKKKFGGEIIVSNRSERINFPVIYKFSGFVFQLIRRFF
jgi:serine/alanine adding enzyme